MSRKPPVTTTAAPARVAPLRPRPRLFAALVGGFLLWLAALWALWLATRAG